MKRTLLYPAIPVVLTALGCAAGPTESSTPYLRGVITSRAPWLIGVRDAGGGIRTDSVPRMLVEKEPGDRRPCAPAAWFVIDGETRVLALRAQRPDTSALTLGREVSVWAEGIVLHSCTPITYAAVVLLEK